MKIPGKTLFFRFVEKMGTLLKTAIASVKKSPAKMSAGREENCLSGQLSAFLFLPSHPAVIWNSAPVEVAFVVYNPRT
ncbi:MAG TPA: hypothetical protein VFU15_10560 [Bacteroidia bacterium]|nr:hypothetical protein [Bacteroidia bacterium]